MILNNRVLIEKLLKTKHLLVEKELSKLKTFDSSYFIGKSYLEEDGTQNYLVFQPIYKYFKAFPISQYLEYVSEWKSIGLSNESIKAISTCDNSFNLTLSYYGTKIRVKFAGVYLKQPKISYTHRKIVNIYVVYELGASSSNDSDPTLKNCLFGAVTLTKNADIDKYKYSGYGIGFDRRSSFSFPGGGFGQNILIFGVDMSSSAHIDNKENAILVLGKRPTQGLEHTLTAEKMYSLVLLWQKKFCTIEKQIVICLSIVQKFTHLKQKTLRLWQVHYVEEIFQKIGQQIIWKKQGLVDMSMILVLIMILSMLMIWKTFISIWWRKMM